MKCEKCFFLTYIDAGVITDYPLRHCKYYNFYFIPAPMGQRKTWSTDGCNIHPSTVAKAKRKFMEELENETCKDDPQ